MCEEWVLIQCVTHEQLLRHLELCAAGPANIMRHDVLVTELHHLVLRLGLVSRYEPRGLVPGAGKGGPDLLAVNYPARTVTTCFDVSVVNVRASAAAKSRVSAPLAAAKERDASKVKKWRALCADGGLEFVPLSFEAQGAFGLGVQQLLHVARSALEEEQDLAVGGDCVHARDERTWLAPTEYQYRKQRLVVAIGGIPGWCCLDWLHWVGTRWFGRICSPLPLDYLTGVGCPAW